jgi:hypothetical protein
MNFLNDLMLDPVIAAVVRRETMGPRPAPQPRRDMYGNIMSDEPSPTPPPATAPDAGINADAPAPGPAPAPPDISTIAGMQPSQSRIDPTVAGMKQFTPPQTPETGDYTLLVGDDPRNRPGGMGPIPPGTQGGFGGRLKRALPGILASAIAGGAMPNQAAGGPTDIFRALQAGGDTAERRDLIAYNRDRQRVLDDLNRRKEEAQMADWQSQAKMRDSQTKYYDAQANAKAAVDPKEDLYKQFMAEADPNKKKVLHQLWLEAMGHAPKEEPNEIRTRFGIYDRAKGEYITLNQQQMIEDRINDLAKTKGPLWTPALVVKFMTPEERNYVLTGQMKPEKQPGNLNPTELYLQAASGDPAARKAVDLMQRPALTGQDLHDKQVRAAKLRSAEVNYQGALSAAEKAYSAGLAKINTPGVAPGTRNARGEASRISLADYEAQKAALLDTLVKAKNAAHAEMQSAQIENDPEHFRPHPGYGPDGQAMPAPQDALPQDANDYLHSLPKPGQTPQGNGRGGRAWY